MLQSACQVFHKDEMTLTRSGMFLFLLFKDRRFAVGGGTAGIWK
jgi:hypothetical protein